MKGFLAVAVLLIAPCMWCQPVLPSWLASYPGATVSRQNVGSMAVATFTTNDSADAVREHYRGLFEGEKLPFAPTSTALGTAVQATAECGKLLLYIHSSGTGSSVRVSCSVQPEPAAPTSKGTYEQNVAKMLELHHQRVAEMGFHRQQRPDAPAPALVWPAWLTHVEGGWLATQKSTDQAGNGVLQTKFTTSTPMSTIYTFYKDLLTANGYSVNRGTVQTGHTSTGIQQNAYGEVEGSQYPDGSPGPRTEIHASFSRMYLNDPITVNIRFTAYAYRAPRAPER